MTEQNNGMIQTKPINISLKGVEVCFAMHPDRLGKMKLSDIEKSKFNPTASITLLLDPENKQTDGLLALLKELKDKSYKVFEQQNENAEMMKKGFSKDEKGNIKFPIPLATLKKNTNSDYDNETYIKKHFEIPEIYYIKDGERIECFPNSGDIININLEIYAVLYSNNNTAIKKKPLEIEIIKKSNKTYDTKLSPKIIDIDFENKTEKVDSNDKAKNKKAEKDDAFTIDEDDII